MEALSFQVNSTETGLTCLPEIGQLVRLAATAVDPAFDVVTHEGQFTIFKNGGPVWWILKDKETEVAGTEVWRLRVAISMAMHPDAEIEAWDRGVWTVKTFTGTPATIFAGIQALASRIYSDLYQAQCLLNLWLAERTLANSLK